MELTIRAQLQRRGTTIRRRWSPCRSPGPHVRSSASRPGRPSDSLSRHRNVLNFLKVQKIDLTKLTEIMTIDEVKEKLGEIVDECAKSANELQAATGFITLERGFA